MKRLFLPLISFLVALSFQAIAADRSPVTIGFDGAFGLPNSTSDQAIEKGIRVAIDEINRAGGVLGGRPLAVVTDDNRSIPARGIRNVQRLADREDIVALFGGKHSQVVIGQIKVANSRGVPFLVAWASGNNLIEDDVRPNFAFRLSLQDRLAMPVLLGHAVKQGYHRMGLFLRNNAWGRSNRAAAERWFAANRSATLVDSVWINEGATSLLAEYRAMLAAGAKAIVLVSNEDEAAVLVREISRLPAAERLPIVSHWGITGGDFLQRLGDPALLDGTDLSVVQTFSFATADAAMVDRVLAVTDRLFGARRAEDIDSPVGFAHGYDLTHILARAIDVAGSADRKAVRDALERVRDYRGLVRHFDRPFTPDRHEALTAQDVFMARYGRNGLLVPLGKVTSPGRS